MEKKIKVVIWNEFRHERTKEKVKAIYPDGLHAAIKQYLDANNEDMDITLAALDDPEQGISDELLESTDVLIWWGHAAHDEVNDELVKKIQARVYAGMGFIALHSAHHSKPFKAIVGTNGNLSWGRNQKEVIWNMMPQHPIAKGIPDHFLVEEEELYCEPFYIPQPDALVFGGWYEDGYIFRSGCCFLRGAGKVFYFQPGHEYCRSYHNPYVLKIIDNAIRWAAPSDIGYEIPDGCPHLLTKVTDEFNN